MPPETVEGQEEDFRSDMYALGSTLYHALAGTPPCNEDSMSTDLLLAAKTQIVPLKQVAPDISDETCAVVDQAMAYYPSERFASYDDMIHELRKAEKHLRQAKHQAHLQATQAHLLPPPKSQSRKPFWIAIGGAVAVIIVIGFIIPKLNDGDPNPTGGGDGPGQNIPAPNNGANTQEDIANDFRRARNALRSGDYESAAGLFSKLHANTNLQEPTRSWAGIESVLCAFLDADSRLARRNAVVSISHLAELSGDDAAAIGDEIPFILSQLETFPPLQAKTSSTSASQTVIAGMLAGLKNWQQGMLDNAAENFRTVASAKLSANDQWVATYQRLASDYLADHSVLTGSLFRSMPIDLGRCERQIEDLEKIVDTLKTKGRARYNVRAWQLDLARQAKELREAENN